MRLHDQGASICNIHNMSMIYLRDIEPSAAILYSFHYVQKRRLIWSDQYMAIDWKQNGDQYFDRDAISG